MWSGGCADNNDVMERLLCHMEPDLRAGKVPRYQTSAGQ